MKALNINVFVFLKEKVSKVPFFLKITFII